MTLKAGKLNKHLARAEALLAKHALSFPHVTEDRPWGHRAFKINKKAFLFLATDGGELSLSTKLPQSADAALLLPFAEPTGYGLGKSGWVSFNPPEHAIPDLAQLKGWVEESYRAQAPRKLVKQLDERG